MTTTFSNKAIILADLWLNYRDEEEFSDFVEYNDLGLPLAYSLANGIIESSKMVEQFITESFDLFISGLGVEDTGYDNLDDLLDATLPPEA
jgi:hypothetical protein